MSIENIVQESIDYEAYYAQIASERIIRRVDDGGLFEQIRDHLGSNDRGARSSFIPKLEFLKGDVTVWGGINGHGKSLIVGQQMSELMMQGEICLSISLEMLPKYTFLRMMRQATGHPIGEQDFSLVAEWIKWASDKVVYADKVGKLTPNECLGIIAYAIDNYSVTQIVIDNLMRVVSGEDNYNAQKDFMQGLCDLALSSEVHIHVVHHVRKGGSETDKIGKFDLRGCSAIADQASNIVLVQRNLAKEQMRQQIENNGGKFPEIKDEEEGDVLLSVVKNRNGEWQGEIPLWFDRRSQTYSTSPNRYLPKLWECE